MIDPLLAEARFLEYEIVHKGHPKFKNIIDKESRN
jgi:hypothetical protein